MFTETSPECNTKLEPNRNGAKAQRRKGNAKESKVGWKDKNTNG